MDLPLTKFSLKQQDILPRKLNQIERGNPRKKPKRIGEVVNTQTLRMWLQLAKHTDVGNLPEEVDDISPEHLEQLKMGFYETKVVVNSEVTSLLSNIP